MPGYESWCHHWAVGKDVSYAVKVATEGARTVGHWGMGIRGTLPCGQAGPVGLVSCLCRDGSVQLAKPGQEHLASSGTMNIGCPHMVIGSGLTESVDFLLQNGVFCVWQRTPVRFDSNVRAYCCVEVRKRHGRFCGRGLGLWPAAKGLRGVVHSIGVDMQHVCPGSYSPGSLSVCSFLLTPM